MDAATEAQMQRDMEAFYRTHPQRIPMVSGDPAATFTLSGFSFDADGNSGTPVDTVQISVGETVEWVRSDGSHSTTNGTGSGDPQAGSLFDVMMPPTNSFSFTFTTAGTFPFFCRPHEGFGMRGYVVVAEVTDLTPIDARADRHGFVGGPSPNPTSNRTSFRFALREAGHVRVEVYDARGRQVAVAVDRQVGAGTYLAAWNGNTAAGAPAPAGVYYMKLQAPGIVDRAQVTVVR
jgi:plastocyanin